jgi:hypothetical protein
VPSRVYDILKVGSGEDDEVLAGGSICCAPGSTSADLCRPVPGSVKSIVLVF